MKIYYAHAICTYGTNEEKQEITHIKTIFPNHDIVDPGTFKDNPDKQRDGMEYCKKLVSKCDALVFSRLFGKVTAGVGIEIHHALSEKKPVYEIKGSKVKTVKKPLEYISREDTRKLYVQWWLRKRPNFLRLS